MEGMGVRGCNWRVYFVSVLALTVLMIKKN